jgi:hypothetical protein
MFGEIIAVYCENITKHNYPASVPASRKYGVSPLKIGLLMIRETNIGYHNNYSFIHSFINGSTALYYALASYSVS